jgi:uncharacterized protein (DUF849 family)
LPDGRVSQSNAKLVAEAVKRIADHGLQIAKNN